MSAAVRRVRLRFRTDAFEGRQNGGKADAEVGGGDAKRVECNERDGEGSERDVGALVERLSATRLRVHESVPMTFIGPHGPVLNLGDVIEVEAEGEETYRFVRIVERARVRERDALGGGECCNALPRSERAPWRGHRGAETIGTLRRESHRAASACGRRGRVGGAAFRSARYAAPRRGRRLDTSE